jgi:integrase
MAIRGEAKMPAKRITDSFVRNVKLPGKDDRPNQITYIDTMERGLALVLIVGYGGSKTFRALVYRNGQPHSRKLGLYPELSVKDARAQARAYWENPAKFEAEAAPEDFKTVAKEWVRRECKHLHSKPELERILTRYVYPRWAKKRFRDVRRGEVNALLDRVEDNNGPAQADAVLAVVRGICNWYQSRNEEYTSPIVRGMKRHKAVARDRILDDAELRLLWQAAGDSGPFGGLVKLCLLTAQRREKVATIKWEDISDGVWTIAREAREKGTPPALRLPKLARDLLEDLPRIDKNVFVFASGTKKHFNSWSQRKAEIDTLLPPDMPNWTIHDLRRTARSLMSRAGVRPDISERVLGHAIPGVAGVYDRHQYQVEMGQALERLAGLTDSIINPPADNVIHLGASRDIG